VDNEIQDSVFQCWNENEFMPVIYRELDGYKYALRFKNGILRSLDNLIDVQDEAYTPQDRCRNGITTKTP